MTFYLYINGSLKNQETYNISLDQLTVSYSAPWEFSFTQHKKFDTKDFDFEDTVRLETHGPTVIRFEGNIKQIQCTGGTSENIKYTCLGLKKRLEEVILEKNDNMLVVYNEEDVYGIYNEGEVSYIYGPNNDYVKFISGTYLIGNVHIGDIFWNNATPGIKKKIIEIVDSNHCRLEGSYDNFSGAYTIKTFPSTQVGMVIKDGLDAMMSEITSRISGFGYTVAELNAMQTKVPADTACKVMNMMVFIETFLDYQQDYRCYISPATKKIVYVNMDSLAALDVDVAADGKKSYNVKPDISGCYTKIKLQGPYHVERCDFYDWNNPSGSTLERIDATHYKSKTTASGIVAGRFDGETDVECAFSDMPRFGVVEIAGGGQYPPAYGFRNGEITEDGEITFDSDPGGGSGWRLYVRYTWQAPALCAESNWGGTAYSKGVKKTLAEYLFDYQKHQLKGKVTFVPWSPNTYIEDRCMDLPSGGTDNDPLNLCGKTITVGSQQKVISGTGYTESRIYLSNLTGINVGDEFSVDSRDDLTELETLRDALKDEYKDIQYIESIVLASLDFNYCLGKKVRLTNTSDSDFLTYAPIIKVTYDLAGENTTINLTQDPKLQFNEALRRELGKRKKEEENTKVKTAKMIFIYKG